MSHKTNNTIPYKLPIGNRAISSRKLVFVGIINLNLTIILLQMRQAAKSIERKKITFFCCVSHLHRNIFNNEIFINKKQQRYT